jgi:hypothetical protein
VVDKAAVWQILLEAYQFLHNFTYTSIAGSLVRRKVVSDNMVECIKKMYNCTKFCVKCGDDEVTDFVEQRRCIRQGYILSP